MKSSDKTTAAGRTVHSAGEILTFSGPMNAAMEDVEDSALVFDEDGQSVQGKPVPGYPQYTYIPFGADDTLPFELMKTIGSDEVLSQNLFFNILTAYGSGLQYTDMASKQPTTDPEIRRFFLQNSMREFYLEQCTDMKYYFFAVAVIILNRKRDKIVKIRHKDACYCRFEKADGHGNIGHVFFANWRKPGLSKKDVEVLTLLDEKDPLGHLEILTGRAPGKDGITAATSKECKFAVVMRFPTPGQRYYPIPYYTSIFRGDWYDIKRLIGKGKKYKIRNHASVKYQVEINNEYWGKIIEEEHITDPVAIAERIKKEKENIKRFVSGIENSGKVWITGYYIDSYGHEVRMVKITAIDTGKEGGDWSEDVEETSNMLCYGLNVHPNLVGATPGKSQTNNSGSDKRELFTLKQSLETAFHDMLSKVHDLIIFFNGWETKVIPQTPFILLTTLDQNTDAKKVSQDGNVSDPNK